MVKVGQTCFLPSAMDNELVLQGLAVWQQLPCAVQHSNGKTIVVSKLQPAQKCTCITQISNYRMSRDNAGVLTPLCNT